MHNFQPYPINMLEINPFEKINREWFALTTEADGKVNAMTCSWGTMGTLWNKSVLMAFVRESRYTRELLDKSESFSACFFDPADKSNKILLDYLGKTSGHKEDKIKSAHLHMNYDMKIPYIDECNFALICKKLAKIPITEDMILDKDIVPKNYANGDYHYIYIGEVVDALAR